MIAEPSQTKPDPQQLKYYARDVGKLRVACRESGENTQETLENQIEQLSEQEMAAVRAGAFELEKNAYANSKEVYAHTPPLEQAAVLNKWLNAGPSTSICRRPAGGCQNATRKEICTVVNNNGLKPWYSQSETLLVAEDLRKTYGARVALRKLSFTLQAGHVMGFLGPNGAGKTTSIRVLTTMLEPTSGHFVVDGISSENPEKIRQVIGVLPEGQGFPKHITGLDYLVYFAQLYGQSKSEARKLSLALLQDVGMQQRGAALIGTYSHGMRQRLGIARALVNDPKVVFLDEPTLGLDPRGQHELLALIQRVARERNTGVILSSHLLSEIEGICDDVIIMNAGEVVAHGTVAEVIGQTRLSANHRNALRIRVPTPSLPQAEQIVAALPNIQEVTPADEAGGWLAVSLVERTGTDEAEDPLAKNRILEALINAEIPIMGFEVLGGRLQDVFLELTAEAIG